jgi:hypothetical protein
VNARTPMDQLRCDPNRVPVSVSMRSTDLASADCATSFIAPPITHGHNVPSSMMCRMQLAG